VSKLTKTSIKPARAPKKPVGPKELLFPKIFQINTPWTLTTTSATANQQIGKYKPLHHRFYINAVIIEVYLSTLSTTASLLGTISLLNNTDTMLGPFEASNTSSGALFGVVIPLGKDVFIDNTETISAVCTPTTTTSTVWVVTLVGYEV
jgi:hypothetical protein